ncbi:MAG: hypothetical protein M3Y42_16310 [Actinomycetota bacterium]|nr:hypothetical protein [Actinomycetota bacterium]
MPRGLAVAYGSAGVLHALHEVSGLVEQELRVELLAGEVGSRRPAGLYLGQAGVAWVLDELGHARTARQQLAAAMDVGPLTAGAGLLAGAAGIGLACLRLWLRDRDAETLGWATRCGQLLACSAVPDEHGVHWPAAPSGPAGSSGPAAPSYPVENSGPVGNSWPVGNSYPVGNSWPGWPIGYASGPSGPALYLLYLAQVTGDQSWQTLGRAALDSDLGHFGSAAVRPVPSCWDAGSAGLATALLRYLAVLPDQALVERWEWCRAELLGVRAGGSQLFHGLTGCGMASLDAAELIEDRECLDNAWRIADQLLGAEGQLPDTADLATGVSGVLLFLNRLLVTGPGRLTNANFVLDELLEPN